MEFRKSHFALFLCIIIFEVALASPAPPPPSYPQLPFQCSSPSWQSLLFLPTPPAPSYFHGFLNWNSTQIRQFFQDDVIPHTIAPLAFTGIAIIVLFIFSFWRPIQYCIVGCCCCRARCAEKQLHANPRKVLFSKAILVLKIVVSVLALGIIIAAIYGMAKMDKNLVDEGWVVLENFVNYGNNVTTTVDNLISTVDGFNPILNSVMALIPFTTLNTELQNVGTFLNNVPDPSTVKSTLTTVNTDLTALSATLASTTSNLAFLQTNLNALTTASTALENAPTLLSSISTTLSTLNTDISNMPASGSTTSSNAAVQTALTDVNAADSNINGGWLTSLTTLDTALTTYTTIKTSNVFSNLSADITTLTNEMNSLSTALTTLNSELTSFLASTSSGLNNMQSLLSELVVINATIVQLTTSLQASYNQLDSFYVGLEAFLTSSPTPTTLESDISSLLSSLTMPSSASSFQSELNNASATLAGLPSPYHSYLSTLMTTFASGGTLQTDFNTFRNNIRSFTSTSPTVTYTTTLTSGQTLQPQLVAAGSAITTSQPSSSITSYAVAGSIMSGALSSATFSTDITAMSSAASSVTTQISSMPSLTPYINYMSTVVTQYNALGTPPSQSLSSAQSVLANLYTITNTNVQQAESQVNSIVNQFSGSTASVETNILDPVQNFYNAHNSQIQNYANIVYIVTVCVFALCVLFILLVVLFMWINCQIGLTLSLWFLLIIVVVYFILSIIFTAGLIVANDYCHDLEPLIMDYISPSIQPLAAFYLYQQGTSVQQVLLSANIIDVAQVESEVTDTTQNIVSLVTSSYTPMYKLQALITQITAQSAATISGINNTLTLAAYTPVNAIYENTKLYVCCTSANQVAIVFTVLTVCGWLCLIAAILAWGVLGQIDKLPTGCCGCAAMPTLDSANKRVIPEGQDEKLDIAVIVPPPPGYAPPFVPGVPVGSPNMGEQPDSSSVNLTMTSPSDLSPYSNSPPPQMMGYPHPNMVPNQAYSAGGIPNPAYSAGGIPPHAYSTGGMPPQYPPNQYARPSEGGHLVGAAPPGTIYEPSAPPLHEAPAYEPMMGMPPTNQAHMYHAPTENLQMFPH